MKKKIKKDPLPSLKEMLTADREKLNEYYSTISGIQARCKFGSQNWKRYNDCLNVIRIEREQRALGKGKSSIDLI